MNGVWYAHLETIEDNGDRLIGRWTNSRETACKGNYPGMAVVIRNNIRSSATMVCESGRNVVVIETSRAPTVLTT